MKRGPAPGIVGLPVPTGVGVKPMAMVVIGAPVNVDARDGRLPGPAVAFGVDPRAVRGEGIVEHFGSDRRSSLNDYRFGRRSVLGRRLPGLSVRRWNGIMLLVGRRGDRRYGDPELFVLADHRGDDFGGDSQIGEVNDVIGR